MEPESLQNVFDSVFAGISEVREAFTPKLTPREVGTITSVATGIAKVSGLPGVGFEEVLMFPATCSALRSTWTRTRLALFCWANTGISTREMKSSAPAVSWTWPWATDCWGASSTARPAARWQRARGLRQAPAH